MYATFIRRNREHRKNVGKEHVSCISAKAKTKTTTYHTELTLSSKSLVHQASIPNFRPCHQHSEVYAISFEDECQSLAAVLRPSVLDTAWANACLHPTYYNLESWVQLHLGTRLHTVVLRYPGRVMQVLPASWKMDCQESPVSHSSGNRMNDLRWHPWSSLKHSHFHVELSHRCHWRSNRSTCVQNGCFRVTKVTVSRFLRNTS